eukprot:1456662-Prymnesium_polylepis.1
MEEEAVNTLGAALDAAERGVCARGCNRPPTARPGARTGCTAVARAARPKPTEPYNSLLLANDHAVHRSTGPQLLQLWKHPTGPVPQAAHVSAIAAATHRGAVTRSIVQGWDPSFIDVDLFVADTCSTRGSISSSMSKVS